MTEIRLKSAFGLEEGKILNSNLGLDLLNRLREDLQDIAQVDQEPSLLERENGTNGSLTNKKEIIMGYKLKTHSSAKKRFKATGSGLKEEALLALIFWQSKLQNENVTTVE